MSLLPKLSAAVISTTLLHVGKFGWSVVWVLWHINLSWLFNAKSIFMQIVLLQRIQFSMSTQFNCQKRFYFKLFSLVKQV